MLKMEMTQMKKKKSTSYIYIVAPDENDCVNNPCQNGGICQDLFRGYQCTCAPGWNGNNCTTGEKLFHFLHMSNKKNKKAISL